jgi:hypothetical protein
VAKVLKSDLAKRKYENPKRQEDSLILPRNSKEKCPS